MHKAVFNDRLILMKGVTVVNMKRLSMLCIGLVTALSISVGADAICTRSLLGVHRAEVVPHLEATCLLVKGYV